MAQKYVERPLIIHNTKFDIRQYFLVTAWNPLTVYFYKRCYIRFSSTAYDLTDLRSADAKFRHLCNNSIQSTGGKLDEAAWNDGCMWTSDQLQDHLRQTGHAHAWADVIYPGMCTAIDLTCKAAQEKVQPRKGSYQLFGADFIVDADFRPWLIEVNVRGVGGSLCVGSNSSL